jgi:hypothetical protein
MMRYLFRALYMVVNGQDLEEFLEPARAIREQEEWLSY